MHEMNWKGSPDDLWILANWTPALMKQLYCESPHDMNWESIRQYRKKNKLMLEVWKNMEKPTPYEGMEQERERVTRVRQTAPKVGAAAVEQLIDRESRQKLHGILDETIDQMNIDPSFVKGFRVSQWDGMIKNAEGEIETKKLRGIQLIAEAKDFEPKWPIIQRVESRIYPIKKEAKVKPSGYQTAVILPDPQIGFLRYGDGSIEPTHDPAAIDVALQIIRDLKPSKVICLGDFLDLPEFSRFEQSPEFARMSQMAIDYGHQILAKIRATLPESEIVVLEGNHDKRMEKSLKANAMAAFGLRRAQDVTGWPVLSVPYLCAFDQLNVNYVEGYPAGKYWINERLQAIHGSKIRSNGSTAALIAKQENASTIMGHIHRIESHYDTQNVYQGGRTNAAYSPGCLCRIDGAVPSVKKGSEFSGKPVISYENWAQGLAVVEYEPGDQPYYYQQIYINTFKNHETRYNGRTYRANG